MHFRKALAFLSSALLTLSLSAVVAQERAAAVKAEPAAADIISGKYEGVAKNPTLGDVALVGEIKNNNGTLTGKIDTRHGSLVILKGTIAGSHVNLVFDDNGNEGSVTAELKDGMIVGEWTLVGQTGTFELKRVGSATPAPVQPIKAEAAGPAPSDPVSGEWTASANVQGQPFPFTLKLKADGDKVTGESRSAQGNAPVSKGKLTGDKLTLVIEAPNGSILLTGTVAGSRITGQYDFAGQLQGPWEARKK
jgi:hypothetical protein